MAERTPLYLDFASGEIIEFDTSADTLPSAVVPPAAAEIFQTEIDFGTTPVSDAVFTISNASVAVGCVIVASLAYDAPTGKDLDDMEIEPLIIAAGNVSAGSFEMFVRSACGSYLEGKFKINYLIYNTPL